METSYLGLSVARLLTLHIVQLWVSVFIPIYYRETSAMAKQSHLYLWL